MRQTVGRATEIDVRRSGALVGAVYDLAFFLESTKYARS